MKTLRLFVNLFAIFVFCSSSVAVAQTLPAGIAGQSSLGTMNVPLNLASGISSLDNKSQPTLRSSYEMDSRSLKKPDSRERPVARDLLPLQTTEFQKFVQSSSGKTLALFGYDFFRPEAVSSLQDVPVPADYVLGPGDEVLIRVWGSVDADLRTQIDRNGQISISKVGVLNLAGVRANQLESTVKASISRIYNNFQVSASLGQLRSIQIYVVGQARSPGAYSISSLSSFLGAIFETGGPAATGSMRNIQLRRDGRSVAQIDLYQFILDGDKSKDIKLLPGDVIFIPPAGPRAAVVGALDRPAIYELANSQESLATLLKYSGTASSLTSAHKVLIERIDPSLAKAPRVVEERSLDAAGLAGAVRDGDIVTLFPIAPSFANEVTLRGNVATPLRHVFKPGMRISDLIPERDALITPDYYIKKNQLIQPALNLMNGSSSSAPSQQASTKKSDVEVVNTFKNILEEIHWEYAVIERLSKTELRMQLIPFNLAKAVIQKDTSANLLLEPGDIVTVFSVKDVPVSVEKRSRFVRITGEVNVPGIYQVSSGDTLSSMLRKAGGITSNAYVYGSQFTRESVRLQQQSNLDRAIRLMESDTSASTGLLLQNAATNPNQKGENAQALLIMQKEQVDRLRKLQSTGRIALDLNPKGLSLPSIALEDGDTLSIPTRPDFVGVYGAVLSESSFLYRAGATVGDYLVKSGLTRFADTSNILIARADGSMDSSVGSGSWFGGNSLLSKSLNPGDSIFVPEIIDKRTGYSKFIEGAKDWTSILYQFGLGVSAWRILKN